MTALADNPVLFTELLELEEQQVELYQLFFLHLIKSLGGRVFKRKKEPCSSSLRMNQLVSIRPH